MKQAAVRVPRKAVGAAVDRHARASGICEVIRVDSAHLQIIVDRFEQALQRIVADHAFVHRHQVGWIARGDLRGQLRIAWPGDNIDVDVDVRVLGVEAVDQSRNDPALAFGFGDIDAPAIFGTAFAEEALQVDVRSMVRLGAAAQRQHHEKRGGEPLHRTAAPAIARTICFWKTM